MMINSTVAIIIVNWKKYDITSSCIESILNSTNSNFKIILVDNESDNKKVKNGIIVDDPIIVKCSKNAIKINILQRPGKKIMSSKERNSFKTMSSPKYSAAAM